MTIRKQCSKEPLFQNREIHHYSSYSSMFHPRLILRQTSFALTCRCSLSTL
ncbi:MAG TPA: hypothetical protein ENG10_02840 [Candidatus Bathyarchaeota archaeon]|nr:hypothetical protein [Candidatus Bathyarchaeota archaeon]HEX69213.1 hypothetical protein [Candidatus Bathyarchaeota archaeon]